MPEWGKVSGEREVLSGLLSGILMVGGFALWLLPLFWWSLSGPFMIIVGLLSLMDDAYPYGRQPFLVSMLVGFSAGLVVAVISVMFVAGSIFWLLPIVFVITLVKISMRVIHKIR